MSLIRWQPLKELDTIRHQMNHLLDDLMHQAFEHPHHPKLDTTIWTPAIELKETATNLIVKAEVPGLNITDLDVQVSPQAISIQGEHQIEQDADEPSFFRTEMCYGHFQRLISLPVAVNHTDVKAELHHGVLTLTLLKATPNTIPMVKVDLALRDSPQGFQVSPGSPARAAERNAGQSAEASPALQRQPVAESPIPPRPPLTPPPNMPVKPRELTPHR